VHESKRDSQLGKSENCQGKLSLFTAGNTLLITAITGLRARKRERKRVRELVDQGDSTLPPFGYRY
jgi:hypothetical protein